MISAILKYEFLQNALIASILSGIICGIIGVIISQKKMLMLGGGIAHTAYGGVGLGYLLGFEPILGAGIFAIVSSLILGGIKRKNSVYTDITISLLWALGMASGVFFTSLMPGYPPDINSYLFGNILSVTKNDLYLMAILTLITVLAIVIFYCDWKAYLFDGEFAKIIGIKTKVLENLLLILTSLCIITLIRAVGIILIIALLSAPAAVAFLFSKKLKNQMLIACAFCILFCIVGLLLSYNFGMPSGASIVFVAVITFFILSIVKK